ncbi:hypothetical protein L596_027756 [Steinernema carpocapsae]|uniref:Uncharacterized protein n=1 Tax=Steinernema carpocapsae TaxID=34508 RepID=A0A4U5LWG3_STECR|nr:hypothetical protein L596_027756 [Steinernema carpocapsae]
MLSNVSVYFKSDSTMSRHGYDLYYYCTLPTEVTAPGETTITKYNFAVIREKQGAVTNIGFLYGWPVAENSELSVNVGRFLRLEFSTDGDSTNEDSGSSGSARTTACHKYDAPCFRVFLNVSYLFFAP